MRFSRFFSATALATTLALPAAATPVTIWDLFTIDRLANLSAQWVVAGLRSVVDVTYTHMDVRPLEGRMILTGLEITERNAFGAPCTVSVDRAVLTSAPLDQLLYAGMRAEFIGLTASRDCLDGDVVQMLEMIGANDLSLESAGFDLAYTMSDASGRFSFHANIPDLAQLRGQANLSYLAFDAFEEEPIFDIESAEVELVDQGLWAIAGGQIPPQVLNPALLAQMLRDELLSEDSAPAAPPPETPTDDKGPSEAPSPAPSQDPEWASAQQLSQELITEAANAMAEFAESPGRVAISFSPEAPVRLNEDTFELFDQFESFAYIMRPEITLGAPDLPTRLTGEDLDAISTWLDGGEVEISDEDHLRFATALATGVGAPRDTALAIELLTPLLETGDDAALALAMDNLDALDAGFAYQITLSAAAQGSIAAFRRLDQLEAALQAEDMIEIQMGFADNIDEPTGTETAIELRDRAYAHLTGRGETRNYLISYALATLALANGDAGARTILDEINAMADRAGDEDAGAWAEAIGQAQAAASEIWFDRF